METQRRITQTDFRAWLGSARHQGRPKTHATRVVIWRSARRLAYWRAPSRSRTFSNAAIEDRAVIKGRFVLSRRRNQHAKRVRSLEKCSQLGERFVMLSTENVCACRFSRSRTHGPSEVVRKTELRLGRAQTNCELSAISLKARRPRRTHGQAFHQQPCFHRQRNDCRAGRHVKRPGMDWRKLPRPQRMLRARKRDCRQWRGHGELVRVSELHSLRRSTGPAL